MYNSTYAIYVYTINNEDGQQVIAESEGQAHRYIKDTYMLDGDVITHFDQLGTIEKDSSELEFLDCAF